MITYKQALKAAAQALLDTDEMTNPGRNVTSITLSRGEACTIDVRAVLQSGNARYIDSYSYDPQRTGLTWVSLEEVDE